VRAPARIESRAILLAGKGGGRLWRNSERMGLADADETRESEHGLVELVNIGGGTIGRLTLQPGWRWSRHVRRAHRGDGVVRRPAFHYHLGLESITGDDVIAFFRSTRRSLARVGGALRRVRDGPLASEQGRLAIGTRGVTECNRSGPGARQSALTS
jgi:hypothetical protein